MSDQKQKTAPLQEWQRDAIRTEPPGFMRDVVQDARARPQSASMLPDRLRSQDRPRPPSGGTVPIASPPGIKIIDQMCEAQDSADRAARIRQKIDEVVAAQIEASIKK